MVRWMILIAFVFVTPAVVVAQVAEAPTYKIGDEWRYERTPLCAKRLTDS